MPEPRLRNQSRLFSRHASGIVRPLGEGAAFGRYGVSFVALVVVLGAAAVHASGGTAWLLALAGVGLAFSAARERDRTNALVRAGAAVAVASAGDAVTRWFAAATAVGLAACALGVVDAVAHVDAPTSVATARPLAWRPWKILFGLAALLAFAACARPWPSVAVGAVALVALASFGAASMRVAVVRRLELGVPEKMRVTLALGVIAACVVAGCTLGDRAVFGAVATLATIVCALATSAVCAAKDAAKVGERARVLVAIAFAGAPFVLLAFVAADDGHSPGLAVVAVVGGLVVGALSPAFAASLRPAGGAWLDAVAASRSAMKHGGSDDAMRAALVALREPAKSSHTGAEIYLVDPPRVLFADAAGYLHTREEAVPVHLLDVAAAEPEATLRAEVLEELEVRRPDLRPLSRWLDDHESLAVTLVSGGGEIVALLSIPRGLRKDSISLEEARAFKNLADDFSGVCLTRAALARGLARQVEAAAAVDAAEDRRARAEHALAIEGERHALATTRLARPAAVGVYSAASRLALDALEKKAAAQAPLVVHAPLGVDPVPLLARTHLAGPRGKGPFVLVDATSTREHDVARWKDGGASPLVLAHRGLLVLVDGAALPRDVQQAIGEALAERRSPAGVAEPLDVALAITSARPFAELTETGALDPLLASRFGAELAAPIDLPSLGDRAEDLRAIVTDLLAREGLRARGDAVGIEDKAFAALVEYPFPGGDAELLAIVRRLVANVGRDGVVRAEDVALLELDFSADEVAADVAGPKIRLV